MSLADLLRAVVAEHRDDPAIVGDGRSVTFGGLDSASNRVAQALVADGVAPGDRVAFVDRNSTEFWEVFFGVLKAGAVIVPLNFRLARDEVAWALDDSGASLVVVGEDFAGSVEGLDLPVVVTGAGAPGRLGYDAWLAGRPDTDPRRDVGGSALVEIMYSSGTTGRPKGVLVSAEQFEWATEAFGGCFDVDAASVSCVPLPYYHVAGQGWALITLTRGGRVVQSREPTPGAMLEQIVGHRATHAAMVPAVMALFTQWPAAREADFSALRQLVYGASPISEPLLRSSVELFGADLFQSYGLSETVGVTTLLMPQDHALDADLSRLRSAGRAVPGIELAVRDVATGAPLPPGEVGEVVVRGRSVTPGYWRNAEATAEAFTADGFLRTGDVGSLDEEGYLFLRDRLKDMIITGGENVYPAEVENVLAAHPGVVDVAVVGVPSSTWGEIPLAFVVCGDPAPTGPELIAFARERMAHFKCPTAVEFVSELPRNPSGKILKRELRAPYWAGRSRVVG